MATDIDDDINPLSNREARLRDAVEDLPEPWPTTRERSASEAASRHMDALRFRLDHLVYVEETFGEDQRGLHRNRAERNGILWALRGYKDVKIPSEKRPPKQHSRSYVEESLEECEQLIADGFSHLEAHQPGLLMHKDGIDIAPIRVPLVIWFFMAGRQSLIAS